MLRAIQQAPRWLCGQADGRIMRLDPEANRRCISTTAILNAEPPKKKRRIDPAVLKLRIERKIKKTEREINKLEAEPKQHIPILEYQLTNSDIRDLKARPRHSMEEFGLTPGALLGARRLWSFYRQEQARLERKTVRRVELAQAKALEHLKNLDAELYDNTVAIDETILIPYTSSHIRRETAPNPHYTPPDGIIKDVTKDWVM
uniref:Large ribosomal subunit protein mL40 n=1 Tax=Aceria tosichella TaxID=561515 RepID=A0A6G1SLK6_9ACAR